MTTYYLELNTDADYQHTLEWIARAWAAQNNKPYPWYPDWSTPGADETPDPIYLYVGGMPKAGGGGVIQLDDIARALPAGTQTLTDGTAYDFDVEANELEYNELSDAGKQALVPPRPPWLPLRAATQDK